jgi:ubiquinone biosynthesis monooxygenase Coq7
LSDNLTETERLQSIKMMRINHSGEVCAQALYQGQALMARSSTQYNNLLQAAAEETAHLNWCKQRLQELNGNTSLLNPIWYAGSYAIGVVAGIAGDKISLGFLAETEYQVTAHLEKHLRKLAPNDHKSRVILRQMRDEELQHATKAVQDGAAKLPLPIKLLMRCAAKVLTTTAARI